MHEKIVWRITNTETGRYVDGEEEYVKPLADLLTLLGIRHTVEQTTAWEDE